MLKKISHTMEADVLFPQLGPQYYDERHRGILSRMEAFYAESVTINQTFWGEADTDQRFEMGDQTLWNDLYGNLPANRRRQFSFNRIRRVVNMIDGYQRRNRKSMIAIPVENADNQTADQFTKILMWSAQSEGILETVSDAFRGALVTGMSLLQVWVDYRSDPVSGNIRVDNCPYNAFLIDPYFKKTDLSDCRGLWKRTYLSKREVISLLPDKLDDIMSLYGQDNRDGKFQFQAESYNYGLKNLLTYDEFYYRDFRTQTMLVDSQNGQTYEWKSDNDKELKEFLKLYPQITTVVQDVPTVRLAIVVQGKVMYDGPNPLGIDNYPFIPVLAYYVPQSPYMPFRIQGVVRGLRDAQYLYNRRKIIELDILESQLNSGFKLKENSLVNPNDVYKTGQGQALWIKEEAQMTDVEQFIAPAIPASMIQLSELLGREIQEIAGVSDELLGMADGDQAGILSMLRQGAGLTTLQMLFDNLDNAQKLLGRMIIDIVQTNFTPGKVSSILENQEPSQQFYSKAFGKYDVQIEDGFNTSTQKQMQFAQMLQLREIGVPIPNASLIEAATLQNKDRLIQEMQQEQQQQAQLQQMQLQAQMGEQQARTELAQARAVADRGLGLERASRVEENQALAVERRAAAVRDEESGMLDLVRALKELDDMDIAHIEKLVMLANAIKAQTQATQNPQNPTTTTSG